MKIDDGSKSTKKKKKVISSSKKLVNRNASPSANGWSFQVGAGISLMLDHVREFTHLKMEGKSDDIELTLEEGKKIYAQAKSVTQIGKQGSASTNLSNTLKVLLENEQNGDAFKLVYITNIVNPLSSKISSAFQYGQIYDFSILPTDDQKKIIQKAGTDFPTDKFQLQILYFFGEERNHKFQKIKEKIEEFLRNTINDKSYSSLILNNWFTTFMLNASDIPDDKKKINLTKRQVIFPVIAVIIDPPIDDKEFNKVSDYEDYFEVVQEFRNIISDNICDYEFIMKVLGDYYEKRNIIVDKTNYKYEYTKNEWKNYEEDFVNILDTEKREALIKILLLTTITRNVKIREIKKAVNL